MRVIGDEVEEVRKYNPIIDVLCNFCSDSFRIDDYTFRGGSLRSDFGWGSKHDMCDDRIDICDKCYDWLISNLKIPPEKDYVKPQKENI